MSSFFKAFLLASSIVAASIVGCSSSSSSSNVDTSPGCLGAPGQSCDRGEGAVCPGGSLVCTPCGSGLYTMAEQKCTCTSGTWQCAAHPAGEVTCTSEVGSYVDPSCTELFDAGTDAGNESDAFASGDAL